MTLEQTYQELPRTSLGYLGAYYPSDMKFEIRGAGVAEIRLWSNIDEHDPKSIADSVISIISNCTRVTSTTGTNRYSYKDIYEHDKVAFLLAIQSISFADDDNRVFVKGSCSGSINSCGKIFDKLMVQLGNLDYKPLSGIKKFEKYFNYERGIFEIKTKSYGVIEYKFSTIGVGQMMFNFISTFTPTFVRQNQEMFRIIQSLVTSHERLTTESLRKLQIEQYNTWLPGRLTMQTAIVDSLNAELSDTLKFVCPDCGATFRTKMELIGGYKSMFMPIQSIDDELV